MKLNALKWLCRECDFKIYFYAFDFGKTYWRPNCSTYTHSVNDNHVEGI